MDCRYARERSREWSGAANGGAPDNRTIVYFDLLHGYPALGGVVHYSECLLAGLRALYGSRLVSVRDLGLAPAVFDRPGAIFDTEAALAPELARRFPDAVFLFPNFHSPLKRDVAPGVRVVNIVYDVQFKSCPDLYTADDRGALDTAFRHARDRADEILFISEASRADFIRHFGAPRSHAVVGAPVAIGPATPVSGSTSASPYILSTSHHVTHPHKNLPALLALFAGLATEDPDLQLRLTGFGRDIVLAAVASLPDGVATRVHHHGIVSRKDLDALYGAAVAFVSLSRFEGFNMSAAEAAAHGAPLILSDIPVHRELFGDVAHFWRPETPMTEVARWLAGASRHPWIGAERFTIDAVASAVVARLRQFDGAVAAPVALAHPTSVPQRLAAVTRPEARRSVRTALLSSIAACAVLFAQSPAHAQLYGTLTVGGSGSGQGGRGGAALDSDGNDAPGPFAGGGGGGGPGQGTGTTGGLDSNGNASGGAGGAAGVAINGSLNPTAAGTGSNGDSGLSDTESNVYGGGGAGGYGLVVAGPAIGPAGTGITSGVTFQGGKGGIGASAGGTSGGGGGGGGGVLLIQGGTFGNTGGITGGQGGSGYDTITQMAGLGGAGIESSATVVAIAQQRIAVAAAPGTQTFGATLTNSGQVTGGIGGLILDQPNQSTALTPGKGGAGIALVGGGSISNLDSASVTNGSLIQGGAGGINLGFSSNYTGYSNYTGFSAGREGDGGSGIDLYVGGTVSNGLNATIAGGAGGDGTSNVNGTSALAGGSGGDGIHLLMGALTLQSNKGTIQGGAGGNGGGNAGNANNLGGSGGNGIVLVFGSAASAIDNAAGGLILGGQGGAGGSGAGGFGTGATNGFFNSGSNGGGGILSAAALQVINEAGATIQGGVGGAGGAAEDSQVFSGFGAAARATGPAVNAVAPGATPGTAGAGGAGGTALELDLAGSSLQNAGAILGGVGGASGTIMAGQIGGFGGAGGLGVQLFGDGTITNAGTGTIAGGAGGPGSQGGGSGGLGVNVFVTSVETATLTNAGQISGGAGGAGPSATASGDGGMGVTFSGPGNVVNSGTISGALLADGNRARAILFTGGDHVLTLQTGAQFVGAVDAEPLINEDGTVYFTNKLRLDAASSGSVNIGNILNFNSLDLVDIGNGGGGTWTSVGIGTLVGNPSTGVAAEATVAAGTLVFDPGSVLNVPTLTILTGGTAALSNAASLGNGATAVTLNGGTLRIDGTAVPSLANAISLAGSGGTFDVSNAGATFTIAGVLGGSGGLTKAGAGQLNLTGANTYGGGTVVNAGAVGIGNGQALGGGPVTLADGTRLTFLGDFNLANAVTLPGEAGAEIDTGTHTDTLSGVVSGTGVLIKGGTGALNLASANTYTGGTVVVVGAIGIGNATALGTGLLTLADGTALNFLGSLTFSNNIQLGLSQAVTVDPTFNTNGNTDTVTGQVTGTGSLTKTGTGTLVLTNANTYSGGTALKVGTLAIGNSAALGTGALGMADGTTLQFAADQLTLGNAITLTGNLDPVFDTGGFNATVSGGIAGPGALTKIGTGTLDLTGTSTYTGATTVAAGTLFVDGSAASTTVTVDGGAALGGGGAIGGLVALSGATIAPGFPGTPYTPLTVGAAGVTFNAGSIYRVRIDAAGGTDSLITTGTATISGGTVQAITAVGGIYSPAVLYPIVTANGGVPGTSRFTNVTTSTQFAFLTPTLSYDATHVYLSFTQATVVVPPPSPPAGPPPTPPGTPAPPPVVVPVTFPSVAITPNQAAAASGLQSLPVGNPLYGAVLSQTIGGARQAFDATSGEAHASAATAGIMDARFISGAIFDRLWNIGGAGGDAYQILQNFGPTTLPTLLRCYAPNDTVTASILSSYSVWGQAIGAFGRNGGSGNAAALDRTLGGFIFGADVPVYGVWGDVWRFGVAGGYTNDGFDVKNRASTGTYESVFGTLYGGARLGAVDLRFGASYGGNDTNLRRTAAFPGFLDNVRSSYGGETVQGFGEVGYRFAIGPNVFEPIAGFTAVHVHQDGFREKGGAAALIGFGRDTDVQTAVLGFRAEATPSATLPVVARLMLGWQHAFGDLDPTSVVAFASGSTPFTVAGAPIDRDTAVAEAGLEYRATAAMTLGLSYAGQIGGRAYENDVKGRMEYRF